jgi:hypothetical protein
MPVCTNGIHQRRTLSGGEVGAWQLLLVLVAGNAIHLILDAISEREGWGALEVKRYLAQDQLPEACAVGNSNDSICDEWHILS